MQRGSHLFSNYQSSLFRLINVSSLTLLVLIVFFVAAGEVGLVEAIANPAETNNTDFFNKHDLLNLKMKKSPKNKHHNPFLGLDPWLVAEVAVAAGALRLTPLVEG
jgi:hypothetical protein